MYNPQLQTFIRVADAGSFNKAAEESYITPTAVIKQINLLETDLDVKLFERSRRGLTLTKAGQSLYNDAKYIIRYCKDSVTRAKNAMHDVDDVIRIGTSPMTPSQILMKFTNCVPESNFNLCRLKTLRKTRGKFLGISGKISMSSQEYLTIRC